MIETDFQKELVASAKRRNGKGWVISDKFRKGRPDVLLKLIPHEILIAECKLVKYVKPPLHIPVETTDLQQLELIDLQRCEVLAPVLVCLLVDNKPPVCYTIWDINAEKISLEEYDDLKVVRGEKKDWDIELIYQLAQRGKMRYGITRRQPKDR